MTALLVANLVQETVPAPGTGTVQLAGVVASGFVPWTSQFTNGQLVAYALSDGTKTEIGEGTFSNSAGVATLTRTTVLWSSLGGTSTINFTSSCRCWNACPAERLAYLDDTLHLPFSTMPRPLQDMQRTLTSYTVTAAVAKLHFDTLALNQLGISGSAPYGTFTIASAGWYHLALSVRMQTQTTLNGYFGFCAIEKVTGGTTTQISSGGTGLSVPVQSAGCNLVWDGALAAGDVINATMIITTTISPAGDLKVGGSADMYFACTRMSP